MSGPGIVDVVAVVLAGHTGDFTQRDFWMCCSCGTNWHVDGPTLYADVKAEFAAHQARAVLAALTEAGTVEWGSEHVIEGKRAIETHQWPDRNTALSKIAIFGGRVVSRLTLPWTAVE